MNPPIDETTLPTTPYAAGNGDNYEAAYLKTLSEQERASNNAAADAFLAEFEDQPVAPQQPAAVPSVAAPPAAQQKESPGFFKEAGKAVVGGVVDAGRNLWNTVDDAATWLDNNAWDLRFGSSTFGHVGGRQDTISGIVSPHAAKAQIGEVDALKNETTGGNVARSIVQFMVPYMGAMKGMKAAGLVASSNAGKAGLAMAGGAVADFTAFDPHAERLSNLINDFSEEHPSLKNPITEYLAAAPGDTAMEGRLKNALEGMGLGLAAEGIFKGIRMLREYRSAKAQAGIRDVMETAARPLSTEELGSNPSSKPTEQTPTLAQQVENARTAAEDGAPVANDPAVTDLARREVAGVAPVATMPPKVNPRIPGSNVDEIVTALKGGDMAEIAARVRESDFNFDHIDSEADIKELIDGISAVFAKETDRAKHSIQSFDQIKELAAEVGADMQTLTQLYKGTDNLGARIVAHRSLLAASAEKVRDLAQLAMNGDVTSTLALRKQVALHASLQAQIKGVQTEVARALASFRITASSVNLAVEERGALIDMMGGMDANRRFAQQLSEITDPRKLNRVIEKSAWAKSADALFEGWRAGLLSGPSTHVANFTGNIITALFSPAEKLTASLVGTVLKNPESIHIGEVKAHLYGMVQGTLASIRMGADGFRTLSNAGGQIIKGDYHGSLQAIREGEDTLPEAVKALFNDDAGPNGLYGGLTGDIIEHTPSISSANFKLDPKSAFGKGVDLLGGALRVPYRALASADAMFQMMNYTAELHAQAYRIAKHEGLTGDELVSRIARLSEDPTPDMLNAARKLAAENTFQEPLGELGQKIQGIQRGLSNLDGPASLLLGLPARMVLPFIRTPTNIVKYWGRRTPGLNMLSQQYRQAVEAGGAQAQLARAKVQMGGMLYVAGLTLAAGGYITGGGEKDKTAESLGGWQPYSIKLGDTYVAFNRADPVGMFLGMAADMSDMWGHYQDSGEDLATMALLSISRNLTSKTWLSGVSDAIEVIASGDERKAERYIQRQAGSFFPYSGMARALRREDDELQREVWSVMDSLRNNVPGLSKDLPPHVNLLGEDVKVKGGMGIDIMSPFAQSTINPSPAAQEIARLNLDLRHPPRSISPGRGAPLIDLTPQQYYRWMKLIGNEAKDPQGLGFKERLEQMVQSQEYQDLPEDPTGTQYMDGKEFAIKRLHELYKRHATQLLYQEFPELQEQIQKERYNAKAARTGNPLLTQ